MTNPITTIHVIVVIMDILKLYICLMLQLYVVHVLTVWLSLGTKKKNLVRIRKVSSQLEMMQFLLINTVTTRA